MRSLSRAAGRCLALALVAVGTFAGAQTYPEKPVEWVVPYPAGGGTDIVARTLGEAMSAVLGQPLVILNKPGAATNIGAEYTANAKPDGYTLMSADTATLAANPFIYSKLGYDVEKDFDSVGLTVRFPLILVVNPSVPAKNLQAFLEWGRKEARGLNYATPGSGSPHHLATELFKHETGLSLTHVPYRGAAPAVQDVVGGQVPFMFIDTAAGRQLINAGKLQPIGIASMQRVAGFDAIPTLDEQGLKGFEAYAWQGLVIPKGTPPEIVGKLNEALLKAIDTPPVKTRLHELGLESTPSSPAEMDDYAAAERRKWGEVIKASGIKAD
jgi:tripartite-type tricarboxylate transporter receptor subunit TctC